MGKVVLEIEGDSVKVLNTELLADAKARLFFRSMLGGKAEALGWVCPRRKLTTQALVIRINTFLENKGWVVERHGPADDIVQREIERKRSFQRTRQEATEFRKGVFHLSASEVETTLADFGWKQGTRALRPHQTMGMLHALTAINAANFSVPGAGKTATTLAVAATHLAKGNIDLVVVVGPLSSFAPWESETRTALGDKVVVRRVRGSSHQRRTAYLGARPGQILLLSYGTAAADRLVLIEVCRCFRVMLVVDESHRVKRFRGGLWAPALVEIARHCRVRMVLSGTPMPQSGRDLYSQMNILWPGGELTGPRDVFAARVEKDFDSVLRDVQPFVSRTAKAELGLKDYTVTEHEVELSGTQAEIYDLIESHFRKTIEDASSWRDKIDRLRRGRPIRLLQAAANPDLLNKPDSHYALPRIGFTGPALMERLAMYGRSERPAKHAKALELVREIISRGEKVVCWTNFVPNIDQFLALLERELTVECFFIDGRVPTGDETREDEAKQQLVFDSDEPETRERIIQRFLQPAVPAVLIANPASCSESISLHSTCRNAIYLDRTYDCALFLQSVDRIHRLGLPKDAQVNVHIIKATLNNRATIDHLVGQSIETKRARMSQLLEGVSLKPLEQSGDALVEAEGDSADLDALLKFLLGEVA